MPWPRGIYEQYESRLLFKRATRLVVGIKYDITIVGWEALPEPERFLPVE